MFDVNAKLFEIAHRFVSKEDTRYYLNGVFIEPVEKGVALVATDGHRMFIAWDEEGSASEPVILQANKALLSDCAKGERAVEQGYSPETGHAVQVSHRDGHSSTHIAPFIDGTFPDWRRLVNGVPTQIGAEPVAFNSRYLADFAKAARDAAKAVGLNGSAHALSITGYGEDTPAVVNFDAAVSAFGIIMPMRVHRIGGAGLMSCLLPKGSTKPEGEA